MLADINFLEINACVPEALKVCRGMRGPPGATAILQLGHSVHHVHRRQGS